MLVVDTNRMPGGEHMPVALLSSLRESNSKGAVQGNAMGILGLGLTFSDLEGRNPFTSLMLSQSLPILSIKADPMSRSTIIQSGPVSSAQNVSLVMDQSPAYNATASHQFQSLGQATNEHLSLDDLGGIIVGLLLFLLLGALMASSATASPETLNIEQAADLLNVSESYIVKLLEQGAILYTKTGEQAQIQLGDLLAYKEQRDLKRRKALEEMVRLGEEMGLYDEELQ